MSAGRTETASHTPGPWVVYDDSSDGKTNRIEIAALGKTVARIYHSVPAQDMPNALLISAAPELLAALENLVHADNNQSLCDAYFDRARTVIAKARGE